MTNQIGEDLIATLRSKLEERSGQLRKALHQEKSAPERTESDSQDIESTYLSEQDQQVDEGLDQQHAFELREIEAALRRIDAGHYGLCQDCGAGIDVKRLSAYPAAKRCIECKEDFEKQSGIARIT